jgi:N-acetyltransferase 10
MVKKKIDSRIRTLIENGVAQRHRSLFVIVGDRGKDQVVNLHHILSKSRVRARPNVLWCYKKDLGFTSNRQKRANKFKKDVARGVRQVDEENPFEVFLGATEIRYTYYKETDKVLGQTFGMCVLQDFQSLTPNILARTIETVEGGGIVVLLIKTIASLRQLYTMTMDVHARYRTETRDKIVGRFNERFMLSLALCRSCLVVDDELNVLPLSAHVQNISKVTFDTIDTAATLPDAKGRGGDVVLFEDDHVLSEKEVELKELKLSLRDTQPIGPLVELARSLDQAKGLLTFAEAITEKSLKATVALLAARGRGKSAALGLSLACAVATGYSNIFVTAPSPENLRTLFDMAVAGFKALGYREHIDFEVVESTDPALNRAVVRINVFRSHRQTIQYILPEEHTRLSQAELLVIDEAAAIPLPLVQRLIGPYLVFLSSTVNGYEGTGRSLSLKLIKQLREQTSTALHTALSHNNKSVQQATAAAAASSAVAAGSSTAANTAVAANLRGRTLREVTLSEPIRYAEGDLVERWLNELLCLDCANQIPKLTRGVGGGVPHPSVCQLYYVDRDTLFSHHKASEAFLQRMMALYVSSHYRNSPNDLQIMSDAPGHHLFALLGPVTATTALPDILCVVQVCLEGAITRTNYVNQTVNGINPAGDVIPWCVSQQFQSPEFAGLSGARVVRIAVHPELQRMGYGSRAVQLLTDYYEEKFTSLAEHGSDSEDDSDADGPSPKSTGAGVVSDEQLDAQTAGAASTLLSEALAPRKHLPPLLSELSDRRPEPLHWVGVSFGLTLELLRFWRKRGFVPLYVRQTANDVTGEHTCVMVRAQHSAAATRLAAEKGIAHGPSAAAAAAAARAQHGASKDGHGGVGTAAPLWLQSFATDFRKRFTALLGYDFRRLSTPLSMAVLQDPSTQEQAQASRAAAAGPALGDDDEDADAEAAAGAFLSGGGSASSVSLLGAPLTAAEMGLLVGEYDLHRLEAYAKHLVDHHLILDLLPSLAKLYFMGRAHVSLSQTQAAILLGVGLQYKAVNDLERELGVGATQLLALFNKSVRKYTGYLRGIEEDSIAEGLRSKAGAKAQQLLARQDAAIATVGSSVTEELEIAGQEVAQAMKNKQSRLLESLHLESYAIGGKDVDWEANAAALAQSAATGKTVAIKGDAAKHEMRNKSRDAGSIGQKARNAIQQKRSGDHKSGGSKKPRKASD